MASGEREGGGGGRRGECSDGGAWEEKKRGERQQRGILVNFVCSELRGPITTPVCVASATHRLRYDFLLLLDKSAVSRACAMARSVQRRFRVEDTSTLSKSDASPVTIADFAVQALILDELNTDSSNEGGGVNS